MKGRNRIGIVSDRDWSNGRGRSTRLWSPSRHQSPGAPYLPVFGRCGIPRTSPQACRGLLTKPHLEQKLERELHDAGRVCRVDDAESIVIYVSVRLPKLGMIQG